jgi:D-alanyl-D-alanine carboxypeptidase
VASAAPAAPVPAAKVEPAAVAEPAVKIEPAAKAEPLAKVEPAPTPTRSLQAHPQPHTGWIIQIGAFGSADEAKQHLDAAQSKVRALGHADAFTEAVTKGDKTFYRARFAGLDKNEAEATCRELRRSDFACMTVKN